MRNAVKVRTAVEARQMRAKLRVITNERMMESNDFPGMSQQVPASLRMKPYANKISEIRKEAVELFKARTNKHHE